MTTIEEIRAYAHKIAERFHPEKIILFGSYSNGEPNEDSDVDLLVVMDYQGYNWKKASQIRTDLRPPFALDLLVRRSTEIEQKLDESDYFWAALMNSGIVLHEG
jgi:predicted nucleotidyltransferase